MNKRQLIITLIASLIILISAGVVSQIFKAQKTSTVSDQAAQEEIIQVYAKSFPIQNVNSKIDIDGRLNAYEKIDIASEVSGRILPGEKKWKEGSYFKKGETLFELEKKDQQLNLFALRSNLLNAITQIMPDLKFDYPNAYEKWKSYLDKFNIEQNTPQLPEVNNEQEKYYVAGKNIYNLFYSIKSQEDKLNDYTIYAPFNGVFLSATAFPGAVISPGASLGRVMNTSSYELETPISLKDLHLVKHGQHVNLYSQEMESSFSGKISRISNQIDQVTQSVPIYISVRGRGLKDGMYLKGELTGEELIDVSALPIEAIANQNQVYILVNGSIRIKNIDITLRTDNEVYVKGLSPQDQIIIKGLNSLSPGQKAVATKL